jgi:hypothetical protein
MMLLRMKSAHSPVSSETGNFNRRCQAIRFTLEKYSFEKNLQSILNAAAGHESNSLPVGAHEYQVLSNEAISLCEAFANKWSLDIDTLKAKLPALSRLGALSTRKESVNYRTLVWLAMVATPVVLFIIGTLAGLVGLGFHLVQGGR